MVGLCLPTTCGACDAPHVRSRQPWGLPTPLPAGSAVLLVPSGGSGGGGLARRCPQPRARSSRSLECCSSRRAESNLQCDNAAQGSSGSSGGTGGGDGSQRPRRRGKTGRKREDFAFCISRADLSWEQPWLFEQSAALPELHLREQGLAALDDAAAAAAERPPATASFRVQLPTGLGALVVDGTATATLPLRCEFCSEAFEQQASVPFDAVIYLGESGGELAANELEFDLELGFVDITPIVTDALLGSLPTVCLCGGSSCAQHAGKEVAWTAPAAAAPAAASPFAKLLAGGGGGGKKGKRR